MPRILLFPYNPNTEVILRHLSQMDGYTVNLVSSFKEHESKLKECEEKYHVDCSVHFEEKLGMIDEVMLVDPITPLEGEQYVEFVKIVNTAGKEVICSRKLADYLESVLPDCNINLIAEELEEGKIYGTDQLYAINIPVLVSASEGEDCSKFEMQLLMQEFFEKHGLKASYISSNDYGSIFGMHTIPTVLLSESKSLERKVIEFNHFVHDISLRERPDVIVIGIPGGLSRLNDDYTNHFSEIAFVISNAVDIDGGLVNLYFDTRCSGKMIEAYRQYCRIKYEIPCVEICYSRQRVLYDIETEKFDFFHLNNEVSNSTAFKQFFAQNGVVNIANQDDVFAACQRVVSTLQSNPNMI